MHPIPLCTLQLLVPVWLLAADPNPPRLWGLDADTGQELTESVVEAPSKVPGLLVFASPDGRYALSWPERAAAEAANYDVSNELVDLRTGASVARVIDGDGDFEGRNHGGMRVKWRDDSRALVVRLEGKWGPRWVAAFVVGSGGGIREVNFFPAVGEALAKLFAAEAGELWRLSEASVESLVWNVGCEFAEGGGILRIEAEGCLNPKQIPGQVYLEGRLTGTVDLESGALVVSQREVTEAMVAEEE
jgi:hypothetical protein